MWHASATYHCIWTCTERNSCIHAHTAVQTDRQTVGLSQSSLIRSILNVFYSLFTCSSSHCRIVNMEGHHILLEFSFFWNAVLAGRHIKLDQTLSRVRKWSSKSWGYTLPIKQGSPKLHIFWLFYDDVGLKRPHFYMKLATDKRKYHFKPQGTLHSSKKFSGPQTAADFVTILRLKRKCLCNETSANNWKKIFKLLRVITYMRQNLMSFGPQMAEI